MKQSILKFEKNGKQYEVLTPLNFEQSLQMTSKHNLPLTYVMLHFDDLQVLAKPVNHPKGGWGYQMHSENGIKAFGGNPKKVPYIFLVHESAEIVANWLNETKTNYINNIKQLSLIFEVEEITFFALDMTMSDEVLTPSKDPHFWTAKEKDTYKKLEKVLKETANQDDNRLSIRGINKGLQIGDTLTLDELISLLLITAEEVVDNKNDIFFAQAKLAGCPVVIETYTAPCNECSGGYEDCTTDVVTVWAQPDGTIKTTRQHTW